MLNPGNATAASTPGCFKPMSDIRRMTASVRSSDAAVGQLREGDEILLVLRRHEAGRHFVEAPAGQQNQSAINDQRDDAFAQHAADAGGIFLARPGKHAVERTEEPAERFFHRARTASLSARDDP